MRRGAVIGCALALAALAGAAAQADPPARALSFSQLHGWAKDDLHAALKTFLVTCPRLKGSDWRETCEAAKTAGDDPRAFFETYFRPVLVGNPRHALFTGYYEPELPASPVRTARFAYPIYRVPPGLHPGHVWYSRAQIENRHLLAGKGLEIAWLQSPVDVYFLQIQGSGRLHMTDGQVVRVGFAAKNGHRYRSLGREMVKRGILSRHHVSAARIRTWVEQHPAAGQRLMNLNPSYVFFRVLRTPPAKGPIGAMQKPVTAGRTIAVDPDYVPMGAPVWVEKRGRHPMHRLMVAQDTGSAIKGPQRADIFYGSGSKAGHAAGRVRDGGRMVVLMPVSRAVAMLDGTQ